MAGMEWTVEKRYDFNIRAASMSLGGPGAIEWTSSEEDSVNRYANKMMSQGIAFFIAAGNNAVSAQIGTLVVQKMRLRLGHWTKIPVLL